MYELLKQNTTIYIRFITKIAISGVIFCHFHCVNPHIANPNPAKKITVEIYSDDLITKLKTMTINNECSALISLEQTGMIDLFVYIRRDGYYTRLIKCINGDSVHFKLKQVNKNKICGVIFNSIPSKLGVCKNKTVKVILEGGLFDLINTDSMGMFETDVPYNTYFLETWEMFTLYDSLLNDSLEVMKTVSKKVVFNTIYLDIYFKFNAESAESHEQFSFVPDVILN